MSTTTTAKPETKTAEPKTRARPDGQATASAAADTINSAMEAATSGFWQRMMAFNGEAARLAERRAAHYREYFDELACCETPVDAGQAAARAAQTAFQDYAEEFGRLSEIAMSGALTGRQTRAPKR